VWCILELISGGGKAVKGVKGVNPTLEGFTEPGKAACLRPFARVCAFCHCRGAAPCWLTHAEQKPSGRSLGAPRVSRQTRFSHLAMGPPRDHTVQPSGRESEREPGHKTGLRSGKMSWKTTANTAASEECERARDRTLNPMRDQPILTQRASDARL
jgi:hypothetical protein